MNSTTTNTNKKNMDDNDCLMYRPFQSDNIQIKKDHYSTSLDPRGYIPVYEYMINNTPIMWDRETGYVHFTGIWKALGNSKSDIVKMVDSNPELGTKKIRGGFLRIQGTWIPYDYAHLLCKRTAWHIRKELIPIFGQKFPFEALHPDHQDYGCLLLDPIKKSSHLKRNTMRQTKPYTRPMKRKSRENNKMSVTRLLNMDIDDILSSEEELEDDDQQSNTSSPSFRVIQTYPSDNWLNHVPLYDANRIDQDIIDTISATILLQRLSQDDGLRPFKPLESSVIPSKVIVGHQEFTICWDN
ncbi:hypothetical protein MFLAVUS_008229 [Mucor flavus]|uniref:HTH APSES-type domain-containing protein n=1 Tax=Mucor flavus TaxID=439312 RepID=A0ABP9Z6K0_9FUNG